MVYLFRVRKENSVIVWDSPYREKAEKDVLAKLGMSEGDIYLIGYVKCENGVILKGVTEIYNL